MWSSEWHSPAAMNLIRTSLSRGSSSSSSVISHGLPGSRQTGARVVMLIGAPSLDRTGAPVHGRLTAPHVPVLVVALTLRPRRWRGPQVFPSAEDSCATGRGRHDRSDLAFRDAESAVLPPQRRC